MQRLAYRDIELIGKSAYGFAFVGNDMQDKAFEQADEQLKLPKIIRQTIEKMNDIHHTGCIIFEVHEEHLKIHSNLTLFELEKAPLFTSYLEELMRSLPLIDDLGISGFMKPPYKDTRRFAHKAHAPDAFYPRNVKNI